MGLANLELRTRLSQWYFNPLLLMLYDWVLYGFISDRQWGCSVQLLVNRYCRLMDDCHLEVGPGTGYLLDHYNPDSGQLDLMDLSESCLLKTAARLQRYNPRTYRRNILEPILGVEDRYQSIGLNYVLHCVPGGFSDKSIVFGFLKKLLVPGGVLFGATVIDKGGRAGVTASLLMKLLNLTGVFNNRGDSEDGLRDGLDRYFNHVDVRMQGTTALFCATDNGAIFNEKQELLYGQCID